MSESLGCGLFGWEIPGQEIPAPITSHNPKINQKETEEVESVIWN